MDVFIILVLLAFITHAAAQSLTIRSSATPDHQPLTYIEILYTPSIEGAIHDQFSLSFSSSSDDPETNFLQYFTPATYKLTATVGDTADNALNPTLPHFGNFTNHTIPSFPIFYQQAYNNTHLRLYLRVNFLSIDNFITHFPESVINIVVSLTSQDDDTVAPLSATTAMVFTPSILPTEFPPNTPTVIMDYISFNTSSNPFASAFQVKIPPQLNQYPFNRVWVKPIGNWFFSDPEGSVFCHVNGIPLSYSIVPYDFVDEYYFIIGLPTEYSDAYTIQPGSELIFDCQHIGRVADGGLLHNDDALLGFSFQLYNYTQPYYHVNRTSILFVNNNDYPESNLKNAVHMNYYESTDDFFTRQIQWWRAQQAVNAFVNDTTTNVDPKTGNETVIVNEYFLSQLSYLYRIDTTSNTPQVWENGSFNIEMNGLPDNFTFVYGSYAFDCLTDAEEINGKAIDALASAEFHQDKSQSSANTFVSKNIFPTSQTIAEILPVCDPSLSDPIMYVTIQIKHTKIIPEPDFDNPPVMLWVNYDENINLSERTGHQRKITITRKQGNFLDPNPHLFVNNYYDISVYAKKLNETIPNYQLQRGPLSIYSLNLTISNIIAPTTQITLIIPSSDFTFGGEYLNTQNCSINGEVGLIKLFGTPNRTTELILTADFEPDTTYTIDCGNDLLLIESSLKKKQHEEEQKFSLQGYLEQMVSDDNDSHAINLKPPRFVPMIFYDTSAGITHGGASNHVFIHFSDRKFPKPDASNQSHPVVNSAMRIAIAASFMVAVCAVIVIVSLCIAKNKTKDDESSIGLHHESIKTDSSVSQLPEHNQPLLVQ